MGGCVVCSLVEGVREGTVFIVSCKSLVGWKGIKVDQITLK